MIEWMVAMLGQIHISIIALFFVMVSGISRQIVIPHSSWPILLSFDPDMLRHFYKQKCSNSKHSSSTYATWYPSVPLIALRSAFSIISDSHMCLEITLFVTILGKIRPSIYNSNTFLVSNKLISSSRPSYSQICWSEIIDGLIANCVTFCK